MSARQLPPASSAPQVPTGPLRTALRNRYALVSAVGTVAALATREWHAALVILLLTITVLGIMIRNALARA